ncbi:MAG TPA: TfuA-like protein [Myxococcales bacterium]|jgi:hypothetical protein
MSRRKPTDLLVFLGPSLPAAEARALAPCRVLPPARQGDLWRALALRPKAIALVDGVFESVPSVWHHEILAALDAGVAVLGGSSMGALRAAELWQQGMVGVGRIFRMYRDGVLTDDAEVALLHAGAEAGFEAFTVPLVNVRHNAARAQAAGALTGREAKALVKAGQSVFFQDRTWEQVLEAAKLPAKTRARWDAWVRRKGLEDLKALDARACLEAAKALLDSGDLPAVGMIRARPSSLVRRRRLREGATLREGETTVANERILEALARRPDAGSLARDGLRTLLLAGWARELGLEATAEETAEAERAWWREQRVPPSARAEYLARSGLDAGEARTLWESLVLEEKVLERSARMLNDGPADDEGLAFEARRRGLWARAKARGR